MSSSAKFKRRDAKNAEVSIRKSSVRSSRLCGLFAVPDRVTGRPCFASSPSGSTAAFSLIEVLVAILILGVALAGLTRALTTALSSSKESEVHTTAAMIAAAQIESLRAEGGLIDGETEGSYGGGLALYQWKQTISPTQIEGLHEIKVVVANTRSGQNIYELQTLLFEPTADTTTKEKNKKDKKGKQRGGRG